MISPHTLECIFLSMLGLNLIHVSKKEINNKCTWSHGHCHRDHRYQWMKQTNRSVLKCNVLFIISKTFKWFLRQTNGILSIFLRPLTVHCRGNRMPIKLYKETVKQRWWWTFDFCHQYIHMALLKTRSIPVVELISPRKKQPPFRRRYFKMYFQD